MTRRRRLALLLPMALAAACAVENDDEPVTLPTAKAPTTAVATGGGPATTGVSPRFPSEWTDYRHGDTAFGVYLAVERSRGAPELAAAKEDLRRVGYSVPQGETDINCDQGARETLRLAAAVDYVAVVVYFRTREEAQQFVDAFQPRVVGTAQVKVYCRDSGY